MSSRSRQGRKRPAEGRFRIIGGEHRGRRLAFPALEGLRPSPDRVRETAFNWLAPLMPGARCLDLYAGSGALGLEALSRGAAQAVFVERERLACEAIEAHLQTLRSDRGRVHRMRVADYVTRGGVAGEGPFDVVFLDPPYADHALPQLCTLLAESGLLKASAALYLEHDARDAAPDTLEGWPPGWALARSRRAGQVAYHLARAAG